MRCGKVFYFWYRFLPSVLSPQRQAVPVPNPPSVFKKRFFRFRPYRLVIMVLSRKAVKELESTRECIDLRTLLCVNLCVNPWKNYVDNSKIFHSIDQSPEISLASSESSMLKRGSLATSLETRLQDSIIVVWSRLKSLPRLGKDISVISRMR